MTDPLFLVLYDGIAARKTSTIRRINLVFCENEIKKSAVRKVLPRPRSDFITTFEMGHIRIRRR